ncbi:hypothetical protein HNQ60_000840 [Povalibacter uvarum]|uniref:Uncharacterized protein n=1 Tax=Povalibacter uvarum TaxID=732238 RepID=A0A841HHF2_9GAMM|nr:hypothetical protein [Povalibacter uvarum]MBB6091994.1 hypothetical protein [Povalibacter uvarum]
MKSRVTILLWMFLPVVASAADYKAPRLPDGTPDLQGVWTNATQTPLERPAELGNRRALTEEEAIAIEKKARGAVAADAAPSDPSKQIEAGALPPVGNYNLFWTDRGMTAAVIDGEYRSSIIVDPPNGRIPVRSDGSSRLAARMRGESAADGPEQRPLGERCLLSFGSSAGPPMLPTMYNSYYQIVQSPGHVMILVEMVHDVRMIRIGGEHPPASLRKWMGDSIGRWEGDTLVVETTNFRPDQSFRGSSENVVITERFRRVAADKIDYQFTIEDPTVFGSKFTGELPFIAADVNIYEYACHEGNYALPGILAAEREKEKAEAAAKQAKK